MEKKADVDVNFNTPNAHDVECTNCGSLVLRSGSANFVADEPFDVPLIYQKKERHAGDAFETESLNQWWCVYNMFTFENIGFTHAHNGQKYLACADCELGPIGLVHHDEPANDSSGQGQQRFLIALERTKQK